MPLSYSSTALTSAAWPPTTKPNMLATRLLTPKVSAFLGFLDTGLQRLIA
ncbi:hypothetical protein [Niveibacterium sp.]